MGILSIWIIAVAIALAFKRKVEDTAAFGVVIISGGLMICGAVGFLPIGVYLAGLLSFVMAIYIVYKLFKDRNSWKTIFSIGSISIVIFTLLFAATNMGRGIGHADDVTFWGRAIKNLYEFSDIRFVESGFNSIHPLGVIVWDYYILKTWIGYTESFPLLFHSLLNVILLLPLMKYASGRYKYIKALGLAIFVLMLPEPIRGAYGNLYADIFIALAFAYIIMALVDYIATLDKIYLFQILSGLYLSVSMKRIGIINAACALMVVTFGLLIYRHEKYKAKEIYKWLLGFAFVPSISYFIWMSDIKYSVVLFAGLIAGLVLAAIYGSGITQGKVTLIVYSLCISFVIFVVAVYKFSNTGDYWKVLVKNYFSYSVEKKYFLGLGIIPFFAVVAAGIFIFSKKVNLTDKDKVNVTVAFALLLTMVAYWGGYIFIYIKSIAPSNGDIGPYLPSFDRYMAIIYYSLFIMVIKIVVEKFDDKRGIIVVLLVLSMSFYTSTYFSYVFDKKEQVKFYGFEQAGVQLGQKDTVLYVDESPIDIQGVDWFSCFGYEFFLSKCIDSELYYSEQDGYISAQELKRKIAEEDIDYVYIQTVNEVFVDEYETVFPRVSELKSGMVYQVNRANNDIKLVLLN